MDFQIEIEIAVKGRVGSGTLGAVGIPDCLEVEVVPGHSVVLVAAERVGELASLLAALERQGVEIDRITHPS